MIDFYNDLPENLVYAYVPTIDPAITYEYFSSICIYFIFFKKRRNLILINFPKI